MIEFFKALESTYISKILSEVRIRLQRRNADGSLTFRDLSEGEQQLLMVLGLLRFTKEDEALFLLDEPDTHLNPAWSVQYLEFMRRVVGRQPTSQVIMATHNPLVIAELERRDVRIMQRGRDGAHERIYVEMPREDHQYPGRYVSPGLELHVSAASINVGVIYGRRLTSDERKQLGELTDYLDELGFSTAEDDPVYAAFLKKWFKKEDPALREQVSLTPEQQRERKEMIDEIIRELIEEGHW